MRQKRLSFVNEKLMRDMNVIIDPIIIKLNGKVHLEIGSGKGSFITSLAKDNPDITFIALEKNINVCYRIAEKREEQGLENLHIILNDSLELLNFIDGSSIDVIYLNFSDPWPKVRHHKRRLTSNNFLKIYKKLLKDNGYLQLRTDHLDFFNDSIEYIKDEFIISEINYNYISDNYVTEYELKKRKVGKINQLKGYKNEVI